MKKCNLCGKEHDSGCNRADFDPIFAGRYNGVNGEVEKIENEALEAEEKQHVAKKRGRPSKRG